MLVQLTMFPSSKTDPTASVSGEVSKVIDLIDKSGLPYKLGPMSTTIEGEWDEIMPVVNKARLMLRENNQRIHILVGQPGRRR